MKLHLSVKIALMLMVIQIAIVMILVMGYLNVTSYGQIAEVMGNKTFPNAMDVMNFEKFVMKINQSFTNVGVIGSKSLYNKSMSEAKDYYNKANNTIDKLAANYISNAETVKKLNDMKADLKNFYNYGKKFAEQSIKGRQKAESLNRLDRTANKITTPLKVFIDQNKSELKEKIDFIISSTDADAIKIASFGILINLLSIAIGVVLVLKIVRIIKDSQGTAHIFRNSTHEIKLSSESISSTAQDLAQVTNEQAANVEEITSSMEEMSATITQNSQNAKETSDLARKTSEEAEEGGKAVNDTVDAMNKISDKITVIEEIAYQTNLLALNAAIEAARAGEYGKGFAVVAGEVRKLAEKSQSSAQEISSLAVSSVGISQRAGKLLEEIVPKIVKTSDLIQDIEIASEEQTKGVNQINIAMEQLNQVIQQNAATSEELSSASEELMATTDQLDGNAVSMLKKLTNFLTGSDDIGEGDATQGAGESYTAIEHR